MPLSGRHMFIWKLPPILKVELSIRNLIRKANAAHLSGVWIKIASGHRPYNLSNEASFREIVTALKSGGLNVWGWHEPNCRDVEAAANEARVVADIAIAAGLDGVLMDAEVSSPAGFFKGGAREAATYATELKEYLRGAALELAVCSHDVPENFPDFPFSEFAARADYNAPQVYYGSSPSVKHRLEKAVRGNANVDIPMIPVGAGFVGDGGGCASASACAERARAFIDLVDDYKFQAHAFWHWEGAPLALWETLIDSPA